MVGILQGKHKGTKHKDSWRAPDLSPALQWMLRRRITHQLSPEYLSSRHPSVHRYQSSRIIKETEKEKYFSMDQFCLLDHFIYTSKSVMNMRKSVSLLVSSQCYSWATSSFFAYSSWQQPCENSRLVLQRKVRRSCVFVYVTGKVKGRDFRPEFHSFQAQELVLLSSVHSSVNNFLLFI